LVTIQVEMESKNIRKNACTMEIVVFVIVWMADVPIAMNLLD